MIIISMSPIIAKPDEFSADSLCFISNSLNTQNYKTLPIAGDASSRQYFRLVEGENTYILMKWEPYESDENYPFLSVLNHFQKHGVHMPSVIATCPSEGLIILEDLGDLTLERKFWEASDQQNIIDYYRLAIDELTKIHFTCTKDYDDSCVAFNNSFDTKKFLWEMNYAHKHLIEDFCGINLSENDNKLIQRIYESISSTLDKEDKYITHRDYHSRNIMIKLGQLKIIDFQDARLGPLQYDLVSLLQDSYVRLSDTTIESLLTYYFDQANSYLTTPLEINRFRHIYKLQAVQRCYKACGSFTSFHNLRNDSRYLKDVKHTLSLVSGFLEDFPEYKFFNDLIKNEGLLEKDYTQA